MPKTAKVTGTSQRKGRQKRMPVRLPEVMVTEIDRLVDHFPELGYNRQQFVESAVREKLLDLKGLEAGLQGQAERKRQES